MHFPISMLNSVLGGGGDGYFGQGLGKQYPWAKYSPLEWDFLIPHGYSWWILLIPHQFPPTSECYPTLPVMGDMNVCEKSLLLLV